MPTRDWSWSPEGGWEATGSQGGEGPPPTHTAPEPTPVHVLPSSPTAVTPFPRARWYLWGSRPAAASRAGVPLPALQLPLQAPAPPGGGATQGAGPHSGAGPAQELAGEGLAGQS